MQQEKDYTQISYAPHSIPNGASEYGDMSYRLPMTKQHQNIKDQKSKKSDARMPKARALALASRLKQTLAVISLMGFAAFSGLIAYHQIGTAAVTSTATTQGSSATSAQTASV